MTMDIVVSVFLTREKHDAADSLMKSAYFILIRVDYFLERLTNLYMKEISVVHGITSSILSDQDPRFTCQFWKKFNDTTGSRLNFSMPSQNNKQSKRVI